MRGTRIVTDSTPKMEQKSICSTGAKCRYTIVSRNAFAAPIADIPEKPPFTDYTFPRCARECGMPRVGVCDEAAQHCTRGGSPIRDGAPNWYGRTSGLSQWSS